MPLNYLNVNHDFEGKKELKDTNTTNNSTLSLHISAYENSNETPKFDSFGHRNIDSKRNKSDLNKQLFSHSNSIIENPFEFPRQRKRNRNPKPEVMEFKANQRLFDPIPLNKVQLANDFASHFKMPNVIARPNLSPFQMHQQHLYGNQRDSNMWNDETWKPWAQHDLQYRPIHPPHRSAPAPPYAPTSHPPLSSSFHPYGRPERPAPYAKPPYYNEINPPIPYRRNPANRPDYWTPRALPPIVPLKTPHMELWKDFGAPSKPLEVILYARKSAKECSVRWQKPALAPQHAQSHVIKIFENEKLLDTAEIDHNINEYSFKTQPGVFYTCEFRIKDARGINTAEGTIRFRASMLL
uniref:Uncharacterized protein n=1 Tax=Panagrolaimus davidi TaxID=227884 RepID=A0A914NYP6_9BILA